MLNVGGVSPVAELRMPKSGLRLLALNFSFPILTLCMLFAPNYSISKNGEGVGFTRESVHLPHVFRCFVEFYFPFCTRS